MPPNLTFKSGLTLFLVVFGAVFGALWVDRRLDGPASSFDSHPSGPVNSDGTPFDFTSAAEKAVPSVVSIDAAMRSPNFFGETSLTNVGSGSGVVVQSDGYIVTNAHVVRNPMQRGKPVAADVLKVRTSDGKGYNAKVIGIDPTSDLAVLKVEAANLKPATFANSDNLQIGDWVVAVGNQLGFDNSVSVGVVSSKNRWFESKETDTILIDAIQTDATINRGNSGGALCNLQGEVVGINSSIATMDGVYSGVGFAIPVKHVTRVVKDIIEHGFVRYGSIGLTLFRTSFSLAVPQDRQYLKAITNANNEPPDYGVVIDTVEPGSPAANAKLRQLDVLLEIDGRRMYSNIDYVRSTMEKQPGDEIEIKIWSRGQTKTVKVRLESQAP